MSFPYLLCAQFSMFTRNDSNMCFFILNLKSRVQRARQPRFPVGIQPRTFELVQDTLKRLGYSGPVALSCDDTKLLASFRPYYDEDLKGFYVLGNTGAPLHIPDPESFEKVISDSQVKKATKVCHFE